MGYPYKVEESHQGPKVTGNDIWKGFKQSTTVHGIPHVSGASGVAKKIIWLIFSLTAVAWLTYHMFFICSLFFSYRTNIKITILHENVMDFPAVTLCNLNSIKKSALGMEAVIESLLSDDNSKKKKKRRKRYSDSSPVCLSTDRYQHSTGLCYRLFNNEQLKLTGANQAKELCVDIGGSVYMSTSQEKVDFMMSTDLFTIKGVNSYWNWMQNEKWGNKYDLSVAGYTNWNPTYHDNNIDSSHSVVTDSHRWHSKDRDDALDVTYTLCQDMVQCLHTPYDPDGDGTGFCWFMPLGSAPHHSWQRSEELCRTYDPDAKLIEIDSPEKLEYFVNSSGVLSGVTNNTYWVGYENYNWKSDHRTGTWTNFVTDGTATLYISDEGEPALAYIDLNHQWRHGAKNDRTVSSGMMICEINLPVVGTFTTTTTTTTTTTQPTTEEDTTTIQASTAPATTEASTPVETTTIMTTEEATTIKETTTGATTEQATTIEATTVPETTLGATSEPETTIALTTKEATTIPETKMEASTHQPTTDAMSTEDDTTVQTTQTTTSNVEITTIALSTKEATTIPETTNNVETTVQTNEQTTSYEDTTTVTDSTTTQPTTTTISTITTTKTASAVAGRLPLKESFVLQETVVENLAVIPESTKSMMGYSYDEFLLECTYEGGVCPLSDFKKFYSPVLGNCYMFNSGWNTTKPLYKARKTGRIYGLSVVINIGEDEYITKLGGASGARMVINNQNEMPHPEEEGILLETGKVVSVGLRKVLIERLPSPFGNCTDISEDEEIDVFCEKYPVKYSAMDCKKTCYQRELIKKCSCADSRYPYSGKAFPGITTHPCDTNNVVEDDCRYIVNTAFINGELGCDIQCRDVCREAYHTYDLSIAKWPSTVHKEQVVEDFQAKTSRLNLSENGVIEKNLLTVEVFFEDFSYEEIREIPAYNTGQFVSDIGGILGLWLGMSVITIFEFFELAIDLIVFLCAKMARKCKKKHEKKSSTATLIVPLTPSGISLHEDKDGLKNHNSNVPKKFKYPHKDNERPRSNDSGVFDDEGSMNESSFTPPERRIYYKTRRKALQRKASSVSTNILSYDDI